MKVYALEIGKLCENATRLSQAVAFKLKEGSFTRQLLEYATFGGIAA